MTLTRPNVSIRHFCVHRFSAINLTQRVAKGEPLLEVETAKAVLAVEAPGDGILAGVKAQEGAVAPVSQTMAWIVLPGEVSPPEAASAAAGDVKLLV